jgi:hypothetical protein
MATNVLEPLMEESTGKTEGIEEKTVPVTIRQPRKLYWD